MAWENLTLGPVAVGGRCLSGAFFSRKGKPAFAENGLACG
jgi:hypothetical protein